MSNCFRQFHMKYKHIRISAVTNHVSTKLNVDRPDRLRTFIYWLHYIVNFKCLNVKTSNVKRVKIL